MALTNFDTFKEDLFVYLHLQYAADQRWECLQRRIEYLTQYPLPPIHRQLLQASARRIYSTNDQNRAGTSWINPEASMAIGHNSPANTNNQEDHHKRNEGSIGAMDHRNTQGGDEGH